MCNADAVTPDLLDGVLLCGRAIPRNKGVVVPVEAA